MKSKKPQRQRLASANADATPNPSCIENDRVSTNLEVAQVDHAPPSDSEDGDEIIMRRFEAPACMSCAGDRPKGTNASKIYAKRGRVRYVKCRYCNRTWTVEGP
jgi:hypothetical protein